MGNVREALQPIIGCNLKNPILPDLLELTERKLQIVDSEEKKIRLELHCQNQFFSPHDESRITGRPHHLGLPQHGGVERNLGYRRL